MFDFEVTLEHGTFWGIAEISSLYGAPFVNRILVFAHSWDDKNLEVFPEHWLWEPLSDAIMEQYATKEFSN